MDGHAEATPVIEATIPPKNISVPPQPLPRPRSLRVIRIPAPESPNHVTAYPACCSGAMATVIPTSSVEGRRGKRGPSSSCSSSVSVRRRMPSASAMPAAAAMADRSIQRRRRHPISCTGENRPPNSSFAEIPTASVVPRGMYQRDPSPPKVSPASFRGIIPIGIHPLFTRSTFPSPTSMGVTTKYPRGLGARPSVCPAPPGARRGPTRTVFSWA
mmetsp:Transcript_26828/g.53556  ORF Transcript_26828/g.53556 Transcript_26828/m.53556 type:complete len:215 (-) Transcript_26828:356-1000(-)